MLAQTDSNIKTKVKTKNFAEGEEFKGALDKAQSWSQKYSKSEDIPDKEIPDSYDFRNLDGYDFTGEIRDQ